jgi:hypothetical protein
MKRLIVCLIPLLCACSTPAVRCDAHLQRINPPGVSDVPGETVQGAPARRAP